MTTNHREIAFESAIEDHLLNYGGYTKADPEAFDRERCIDTTVFLPFIKNKDLLIYKFLLKRIK